jgi:outer membrane biosynthesis protein TonB
MTTADIMFAQPGNTESFRDHEYDARTILWALLAAVAIHLAVAFLLAAFSGVFSPSLPMPEKPTELTLMDLSPASFVPKNSAFIETDESKKAPEPKDKTFESNANSIGASETDAAGELPLPSQAGKDRPFMDLETHPYSRDMKGAQTEQSTASQQNAKPAPQPAPLTAAEQFALLTQKSAPETERPTEASQAQSAYRPFKERTRISGRITNHGVSSVDALGTPLGHYQKYVLDAIGSRWYALVEQKNDLVNIGTTDVTFVIDRNGHVKNLKIITNTSNETLANVCIQSIQDAQLPPMSEDVVAAVRPEGLPMEIPFTIFVNR